MSVWLDGWVTRRRVLIVHLPLYWITSLFFAQGSNLIASILRTELMNMPNVSNVTKQQLLVMQTEKYATKSTVNNHSICVPRCRMIVDMCGLHLNRLSSIHALAHVRAKAFKWLSVLHQQSCRFSRHPRWEEHRARILTNTFVL